MKYYKILGDNVFIGAITSGNFVAENQRTGWLLTSNESLGQFVSYEGQLYRDYWMQPIYNSAYNFINAQIIEIDAEEYKALIDAIEHDEPIIIDDDDEEEITPDPIIEPDITVEYVRASKLSEMSKACRTAIENGFDIVLSDSNTHHFSLTTQDQLNLMAIASTIQTQDMIPYHADGELMKYYSSEEMKQIIMAANKHKDYHTIYYNALKAYINSLDTLEQIAAITYGVTLPDEFRSEVCKTMGI